eukprot:661328-Ditylum_brightwellii.AAC.1
MDNKTTPPGMVKMALRKELSRHCQCLCEANWCILGKVTIKERSLVTHDVGSWTEVIGSKDEVNHTKQMAPDAVAASGIALACQAKVVK